MKDSKRKRLTGALAWSRCRDMVKERGGEAQDEMQHMLWVRLRAALVVCCLALGMFLIRDLVLTFVPGFQIPDLPPQNIYVGSAVLVVELLLLGLLSCPFRFSRRGLRSIELTSFGLLTLSLATYNYFQLDLAVSEGTQASLLAANRSALVSNFGLVVVYGMFIPNDWKRAAAVILPMSLIPALAPLLIPAAPEAFRAVATPAFITEGIIHRLVAALAAIYASHLITGLRSEASEAKQMGQYQLAEQIGAGGMGEVWKAKHRLLASPAAIKLIRPEVMGNGDAARTDSTLRRFEREARSTAALRSPHTVQLYDFGTTEDGAFYYAMELLQGLDLESLVQRFGPLPASRAVYLLRQACDSLAEAHGCGMIHRDIKPANLFSCRLGINYDFVKVLDFGLVKTIHELGTDTARLTQEGLTTGTPAYLSPELAMGNLDVDSRSDIYALGCVAYWLLTGQLVFEGENSIAIAVAHVSQQPVAPSRRSELEIPLELDEAILACLAKKPEERPQSASELDQLLEAVPLQSPWNRLRAESWWQKHGLLN